jgi:Zn-finger nucleic acid-binding protein
VLNIKSCPACGSRIEQRKIKDIVRVYITCPKCQGISGFFLIDREEYEREEKEELNND